MHSKTPLVKCHALLVLQNSACGVSFFLLCLLESFCHLLKTLLKTLALASYTDNPLGNIAWYNILSSFIAILWRLGNGPLALFWILHINACISFAAARTLRTISFIEGLQVLVTALIDTIRNSVLNVVILLTMLMAFFAVVGYYIFGYEEETGDKENWGTLSTAMLTLFTFVTVSATAFDIHAQWYETTRLIILWWAAGVNTGE